MLLIAGILLHRVVADFPHRWAAAAGALGVAAIVCQRWAALSTVTLSIAVCILGVVVAQLEDFHFPDRDITAYTNDASRLAEVEMIIDQPPRVLMQNSPGGRP